MSAYGVFWIMVGVVIVICTGLNVIGTLLDTMKQEIYRNSKDRDKLNENAIARARLELLEWLLNNACLHSDTKHLLSSNVADIIRGKYPDKEHISSAMRKGRAEHFRRHYEEKEGS